MKKSDVCVVSLIYLVSIIFFVMILQLPKDAQTYPMTVNVVMFALTTLFLIQQLMKAKKEGLKSDFGEIFEGFKSNQFFVVLAACTLYIAAMYFIGFYISSVIFLLGVLLYMKIPKIQCVIVTAIMIVLVYFAFSRFLGVPLPAGILFGR